APSGFKALCTQNLPTPTIGATSTTQANHYFDINLSAATGATRTVSGFNFQPDMVWSKNRTYSTNGRWGQIDSVRGVNKTLCSNLTDAEVTSQSDLLTAFNSDGFSLGADANAYGWNYNQGGNSQYAYWAWKANGAGSSNTAGTITSTVSANTTSGFSIVTYTGTGSNATVGHGIGTAPQMVIIKQRNGIATYWCVYHTSLASGFAVYLNATFAAGSDPGTFNSTAPTSTVFSIGTSTATNTNGNTYVAYCFAPVAGYSAFGSYTGNGSTDGPFVYLGFRPRYIMQKRTDSTGTWELYDTARDTYNVMSADLAANLSDAETSVARFDSLSNGFKIRTTGAATNASGGTYIYACFAENPFKYSLAR
ncbi:MAG TPA: hypothetical protein VLA40_03430, partial [Rheinheimera sp.]|nr:hypothetical protein [Rheinheimera sp.]